MFVPENSEYFGRKMDGTPNLGGGLQPLWPHARNHALLKTWNFHAAFQFIFRPWVIWCVVAITRRKNKSEIIIIDQGVSIRSGLFKSLIYLIASVQASGGKVRENQCDYIGT